MNATHATRLAPSPDATTYAVDPARSAIRYHAVHRLHRVTGTSAAGQGKAVVDADGKAVAGVLVPVSSFRSGDADRDARVHEILGTRGVSFVVFKGRGQLPAGWQRAGGGAAQFQGELTLHGVRRPLTVPVAVEVAPDGALRARASFEVSLEAHEIVRPSLLFFKVEDRCGIELDLVLRPEGR